MFPYLRTAREFIDDCTVPKYLLKESKGKYIITCYDCVGDKIQCNYIDNGNRDDYKCCGNCISSRLVGWLIQRVNNNRACNLYA
ncbi:hypothetical protein [Butyrivibrio sp. NC3005]|uniref:hypothetical protein n=1 Tax=Butyrivibrio sp. NC3005 TaxID=1280685 RepID=UPI0003F92932|nr:hypothetical protein [Butyrivibrio sp. NC3005]